MAVRMQTMGIKVISCVNDDTDSSWTRQLATEPTLGMIDRSNWDMIHVHEASHESENLPGNGRIMAFIVLLKIHLF